MSETGPQEAREDIEESKLVDRLRDVMPDGYEIGRDLPAKRGEDG